MTEDEELLQAFNALKGLRPVGLTLYCIVSKPRSGQQGMSAIRLLFQAAQTSADLLSLLDALEKHLKRCSSSPKGDIHSLLS